MTVVLVIIAMIIDILHKSTQHNILKLTAGRVVSTEMEAASAISSDSI